METMYKNNIDGLCGNDDCGQMSAWYIFTAMGFYPVCPGSGQYAIGRPYFPKMTIHLENGRTLEIRASNADGSSGALATYIQDITLGGRKCKENFLRHEDLANGNTIEFTMNDKTILQ